MKTLALIAAAVLACTIVPLQAFSDDDYNWMPPGLQHRSWPGYSNSTISFGYSNKTISYGYSNSTHNDNETEDEHHQESAKGDHNCNPQTNSTGNYTGEDGCKGINSEVWGYKWGQTMKQYGKNSTIDSSYIVTPEKNKQVMYGIMTHLQYNLPGMDLAHGHHKTPKDNRHQ